MIQLSKLNFDELKWSCTWSLFLIFTITQMNCYVGLWILLVPFQKVPIPPSPPPPPLKVSKNSKGMGGGKSRSFWRKVWSQIGFSRGVGDANKKPYMGGGGDTIQYMQITVCSTMYIGYINDKCLLWYWLSIAINHYSLTLLFQKKEAVMFALKKNKTGFRGRPLRIFPSSENPQQGAYHKKRNTLYVLILENIHTYIHKLFLPWI